MKTIKVENIALYPNPHNVSVRPLYAGDHLQIEYLFLQPGEALKKHVASVDVTLYVLEGSGIVNGGNESYHVDAETLAEIPAQTPHRLINDGETPFCLLNIKAPRPVIPSRVIEEKG